jgi:uncharacterized membrane protein
MIVRRFAGNRILSMMTTSMVVVTALCFVIAAAGISAAQAQAKSESQQSLDKIIQSLKALDTAYASGNTAEAQSNYDTANNEWKSLSSKISARESREVQLLFESLQTKLRDKAPAKDVSRAVRGTLEELREDIRRELKGKRGKREEHR